MLLGRWWRDRSKIWLDSTMLQTSTIPGRIRDARANANRDGPTCRARWRARQRLNRPTTQSLHNPKQTNNWSPLRIKHYWGVFMHHFRSFSQSSKSKTRTLVLAYSGTTPITTRLHSPLPDTTRPAVRTVNCWTKTKTALRGAKITEMARSSITNEVKK